MKETLEQVRDRLMKPPKGMTQKAWWLEVARQTKVPFGTIKKVAEGNTSDPRMSTLTGLAGYLCGTEPAA